MVTRLALALPAAAQDPEDGASGQGLSSFSEASHTATSVTIDYTTDSYGVLNFALVALASSARINASTIVGCAALMRGASGSVTIDGLTPSTAYRALATSRVSAFCPTVGFGDYSITAYSRQFTFTTDTETAELSATSITPSTATLTLTGHAGSWWFEGGKDGATGTCTASSGASLSGLDSASNYTYRAYSDSGCTTQIASASFTTLAGPSLSISDIAVFSATATLNNYQGTWYRKLGGGDCTASAVAAVTLANLTADTPYTLDAYSDSTCTTRIASATFRTSTPILTAAEITGTTAALSLPGYGLAWSVRQILPALGQCAVVPANGAHRLSGLFPLTAYTYSAYSDDDCVSAITSASFTTTETAIRPPREEETAEVRVSGIFAWGDGFRFPLHILNGIIDFEESPRGLVSGALILGAALGVGSAVLWKTGMMLVALGAAAGAGILVSYVSPMPEGFLGLVLIMGVSVFILRGRK